ncbi:pirin family protein [Sphingomonas sp. PP-CC-3A-396]|uniref:pirin family protein n=1 Tax=Sphingomonas sp. PP-CC-3A-396 TaxID=2135655 RepID=UPI0010E28250|nr:pirin family protein [Sphingomonas sp. PP-CC-3A-396]TCQ06532.1 redox-sensitive bicupin YhaK (pirin superfamily) [Sphingomonas sp. PP-CC-3A-396]
MMLSTLATPLPKSAISDRRIVHITRGRGHGDIVRLMSPSDLGERLKPFVFLDLFHINGQTMGGMPVHPHSGIATVTVLVEGDLRYDDPEQGQGTIAYGAVEWMRAGGGVWHGQELSRGESSQVRGFQLWIALPPELENGPVETAYIETKAMPQVGPAKVILGTLHGARSPVNAPDGINYLLVTLQANEEWTYQPPVGHSAAFVAVASGTVDVGSTLHAGDMGIFDQRGAMHFQADEAGPSTFVVGSAIPHPHDLVLGYYSVHSSEDALIRGEARIAELGALLPQADVTGRSVPVFKGA